MIFSPLTNLNSATLMKWLRENSRVVSSDGTTVKECQLAFEQRGELIYGTLRNRGETPVRVHEVVLLDIAHGWPADSPIYGEGFQLLAQTGGTLANPSDLGYYTDREHYRIPEPEGMKTVYGFLMVGHHSGQELIGFASCRRFNGRLGFDGSRLRVSLDCENLVLAPGEEWTLEEVFATSGRDRDVLLEQFAIQIDSVQPRLAWKTPPTGWCSWYCFGPEVTQQDISSNLEWMSSEMPQLRFVQIDDGYQPWMGDWLETQESYGRPIQDTLSDIQQRGFEPALWVAPFIASPQSRLFFEHPDWFIKDENGAPLPSDKIGFGGWRLGPWYALDGTHPDAQKWLTEVFRTMREDWGVTYFKLDANYWGAMHGGHHYDAGATRIEAYRRGMEAIIRGAGDAFILGCNQPMWPSLGVIHGARTSMDVNRNWKMIRHTGRENLLRGWQNGRLWWNDPDCLLLTPTDLGNIMDNGGNAVATVNVSDVELMFHAATVFVSGGTVLSGDNLPSLNHRQTELLRQASVPTGRCFQFADDSLTVGKLDLDGHQWLALLNWSDDEVSHHIDVPAESTVENYWTGKSMDLAATNGELRLSAHSAFLLKMLPKNPG